MRSGRTSKEEEGNSQIGKLGNGKGTVVSSSPGKIDVSALRRSPRETVPKQTTPSQSGLAVRKSERIEKRTTPTASVTPLVKRRSDRLEKQQSTPTTLRRSDRGKKYESASSSMSKQSGERSGSSESCKKKEKRKKSLKKLTFESKKVDILEDDNAAADEHPEKRNKLNVKPTSGSAGMKRKTTMDARSYKAKFKRQRIRVDSPDKDGDIKEPDKLSQDYNANSGRSPSKLSRDKEDTNINDGDKTVVEKFRDGQVQKENGGVSKRSILRSQDIDVNKLENVVEAERSYSSQRHGSVAETPELPQEGALLVPSNEIKNCDSEMVPSDSSSASCNLQTSKLATSGSVCGRDGLGSEVADKCMLLESPKFGLQASNEVAVASASKDASGEPALSVSTEHEKHNLFGICVGCSKNTRGPYDLPEVELCSCSVTLSKLNDIVKETGIWECEASGSTDKLVGGIGKLRVKDGHEDICATCKQGGGLLKHCDGKGCKKCYHLSCLHPVHDDGLPGVWHCPCCVQKKIKLGVHSVSGAESIWAAREVEVSDVKGFSRQKQFLVKYEGLGHIHNHWVPEGQLLIEAPSLVARFNQNHQCVTWNPEWVVPQRLLKKRLLVSSKQQYECNNGQAGGLPDCSYEWLVKWRGLGYEHASWELPNACFLQSPHGQDLVRDYEIRREKARKLSDKSKKGFFSNSVLPGGGSSPMNNMILDDVNKLREVWYKSQNAVVLNDPEQAMKVILFILSVSDVAWPFLIIIPSSAISLWEVEFRKLAPSTNVVVYDGNKESRKNIRTMEFYEEGGSVMLEVLLSTPEIITEDLEILRCISWEVIVDEFQRSSISFHFEKMKLLPTRSRMLLFSGQIKDTTSEYVNILKLLDSHADGCLKPESNSNLGKLKERLSRFIAFGNKAELSKFVEFWVPVQISNLQLEQYCSILVSNSFALCSSSKSDAIGALHDILTSIRKCCDHPYLANPSPFKFVKEKFPDSEFLSVGIQASGKLELLGMMLSEIKDRKLRVLIYFQNLAGGVGVTMGDILEDFVSQRFGRGSYERVDAHVRSAKERQAAMNNFNNKTSEQFVFLLENRACLPSIKLSSVSAIIIFDSDWNPANDMKALQKITIDSQSEHIKIFRLYSSFTVEEKVLMLAKQGLNLDYNLQNISRSSSDTLLMWGVPFLFSRLDQYLADESPISTLNISSGRLHFDEVFREFLSIISESCDSIDACQSVISKVQLNLGSYITNILLRGDQNNELSEGEPHVFWKKMLGGRNPKWKYSDESTTRNRKRAQFSDVSSRKPEDEIDEKGKKRRKVVNSSMQPALVQSTSEVNQGGSSNGGESSALATKWSESLLESKSFKFDGVNATPKHPFSFESSMKVGLVESGGRRPLYDEQRSCRIILKAEMAKLFKFLEIPDEVKQMAEKFMEYVVENHQVEKEPAAVFHAFQISLCWTAASIVKQKINKKDSLMLARQLLNFCCDEEVANQVYTKMRPLKKPFLQRVGDNSNSVKYFGSVVAGDLKREPLNAADSPPATPELRNAKGKIDESSEALDLSNNKTLTMQNQTLACRNENDLETVMHMIQEKCDRQMNMLRRKHEDEIEEFLKTWEEKKVKLEREHRVELALVRSMHSQVAVRMEKVKLLNDEFAVKLEKHKCQKGDQLKDLETKHAAAREEERRRAALLLAEAKSRGSECTASFELHLHGVEPEIEPGSSHATVASSGAESADPISGAVEEDNRDSCLQVVKSPNLGQTDVPSAAPNNVVSCGVPSKSKSTFTTENNVNESSVIFVETASATDELHKLCSAENDAVTRHLIPVVVPTLNKEASDEDPSQPQNKVVLPGKLLTATPEGVPSVESGGMRTAVLESIAPNNCGNDNSSKNVVPVDIPSQPGEVPDEVSSSPQNKVVLPGEPLTAAPEVVVRVGSTEMNTGVVESIPVNNDSATVSDLPDLSVDQRSEADNCTNNDLPLSYHNDSLLQAEVIQSADHQCLTCTEVQDNEPLTVNQCEPCKCTPLRPVDSCAGCGALKAESLKQLQPDSADVTAHCNPQSRNESESQHLAGENLPVSQNPSEEQTDNTHLGPVIAGPNVHVDREGPVTETSTQLLPADDNVPLGLSEHLGSDTSNQPLGTEVAGDCNQLAGNEAASQHSASENLCGSQNLREGQSEQLQMVPVNAGPDVQANFEECATGNSTELLSAVANVSLGSSNRLGSDALNRPLGTEDARFREIRSEEQIEVISGPDDDVPDVLPGRELPAAEMSGHGQLPAVLSPRGHQHSLAVVADNTPNKGGKLLTTSQHSLAVAADQTPNKEGNLLTTCQAPQLDRAGASAVYGTKEDGRSNSGVLENQLNSQSTSRVYHGPNGDSYSTSQQTEAPSGRVGTLPTVPSGANLHSGVNVTGNLDMLQGPSNVPLHSGNQVSSMNQTGTLHEPLYYEMEKLRREIEHAMKVHEEIKVGIKSDCEREIEEMIAQIRKKYEDKLRDAEAAFMQKKNELDMRHNLVHMNKTLAEAFRSKCLDLRPSGMAGIRQVSPSGLVHHRHQLSSQPVLGHVAGLSSSGQCSNQHIVDSSRVAVQPVLRPTTGASVSFAAQPIVTAGSHVIPRSTSFHSGAPCRPPHISAITPGNLRVGGEIRAPAPHLQPYRQCSYSSAAGNMSVPQGSLSSTSCSASTLAPNSLSSISCSMPPQQSPPNLSTILSTFQQIPPQQLPSMVSPNLQPQLTPLSLKYSGSHNRVVNAGTGGSLTHHPNSSALELLMEIDNRNSAKMSNMLRPVNFESSNSSNFRSAGDGRGGSTSSDPTGVVCLSDDE